MKVPQPPRSLHPRPWRPAVALVTALAALLGALAVVAPASAAPGQSSDDPYPATAWEGNPNPDHWSAGETGEQRAEAQGWRELWEGTGCTGRVGIRRVTQQWIDQTKQDNQSGTGDNSYRIRVQVKCPQDVESKIRALNQNKGLAEAPVISIECHATFGDGDSAANRSDWVMERTARATAGMYAKFRKTYPNNADQKTKGVCSFEWPLPGLSEQQRTVSFNSPELGGGSDAERRRVGQTGDALEDAEWDATEWSKEGADASEDADKRNGWHTIDNGCIARVGIRRVTAAWLQENQQKNWNRLRAQIKCQDYTGPSGGEVRTECQIIGGSAPSGQNWDVSTRRVSGADLEGLRDGERRAAKKYRRTFLNNQDTAVSARCIFRWVGADNQASNTTEAVTITSPSLGGDRRSGSDGQQQPN
jgi:hypothetical protein